MTESVTPSAPEGTSTPTEASDAPLPNMTGAEAKAYVDALKANKAPPKAPVAKAAPEAKPEKETAQEIAKEVARKFKVKIDGQEKEIEEAELLRGYSHQQAANKALQEGKQLRKQSEELLNYLKDPARFFEVAKQLGHDPRQLSENHLIEILNDELMDPKDRELKQLRQQMAAREAMEAERKREIESERQRQLKEKFAKQYSDEFIPALQAEKLPPNKETIAKMAYYVAQAAELKMPMSMNEAAKLVKEDLLRVHKNVYADADGEDLLNLIGPEVAEKIRKHFVAQLKNPQQFLKTPEPNPEQRRNRRAPTKRMSHAEWRNFNRS